MIGHFTSTTLLNFCMALEEVSIPCRFGFGQTFHFAFLEFSLEVLQVHNSLVTFLMCIVNILSGQGPLEPFSPLFKLHE